MKKVHATVEVPDEIKTVEEADEWIWEKMKRAVEMGMIELLPNVDVYQVRER